MCTPFDDEEEHGNTFEAKGTYRRLDADLCQRRWWPQRDGSELAEFTYVISLRALK